MNIRLTAWKKEDENSKTGRTISIPPDTNEVEITVDIETVTKEQIIRNASIDELWCLFHTFKEHANELLEKKGSPKLVILDGEIHQVVKQMKRAYQRP